MTHLRRQKKKRKEKREEVHWTKVIDWLLKVGVTQDVLDRVRETAISCTTYVPRYLEVAFCLVGCYGDNITMVSNY